MIFLHSFSDLPSPNRACGFPRTRLSSIGALAFRRALTSVRLIIGRVMGSPCSTASWHLLQRSNVFRLRAIILFTHSGFGLPVHTCGGCSSRVALISHDSDTPPHVATSGFLSCRGILT